MPTALVACTSLELKYRSSYEEDADMTWVGKMDTPNGTAYFYEAAILALPMPDGKHYITRMD